jgi:hypothetical protein
MYALQNFFNFAPTALFVLGSLIGLIVWVRS